MNQLPDAQVFTIARGKSGKLLRKNTHDLWKNKDILVVGVNGAFTPKDTEMVLGYEANYEKIIDETVVDEIYIVSMNDPYVMRAWFKDMKIKKLKHLPDGNGAFSLRLDHQGGMAGGITVNEMYNKGMGKRGWRYAMLIENNIQMAYIEEETPDGQEDRNNLPMDDLVHTTWDKALEFLKNREQGDRIKTSNYHSYDQSLPQ
tara:strand:- start:284 stop:889 length:606 start_codon:yes stop_codon:yes gene_type:complete